MRAARTRSAVPAGAGGRQVTVEADITNGLPATILAGLPDAYLQTTRDRVRAAVINSGEHWPGSKITVTLSPASLPKPSGALDLAVAVAVLVADGQLPEPPGSMLFLAELGLDGRLRPVPGALPAMLGAAEPHTDTVIVAAGSSAEASLAAGITVMTADSLAEVLTWLRGSSALRSVASRSGAGSFSGAVPPLPALGVLARQSRALLAAEACAAGGHHLSVTGLPGAGKTALARWLHRLLPPLDDAAAIEVASVRSAAGLLAPEGRLAAEPPFCSPSPAVSPAAMLGGGPGLARPGQASLAHRGVLLLEQAPEFRRDVLDALRQPLESGQVIISRAGSRSVFPARFTLVLTAVPCPCAKDAGPGSHACSCSPAARRRYLARLSGPLLDRVDVKVRLGPADHVPVPDELGPAEPGRAAQRVAEARQRAAARLSATPWHLNSQVPGTALRRSFPPRAAALAEVERAVELGQVSARGADSIVRVAWTLADLAGQDQPDAAHVSRAAGFRRG